ncbi:CLUMA_CG021110, isoform A [Clunio marinus]|uniref:CLUMA_CG021110, isoform A n=1 Tax=Clunio marinus TaxID=568069 RepID=A0A1J1J866_9DIPT|nr:CLUMA_CG021110, isoform A [Clunio marinus]
MFKITNTESCLIIHLLCQKPWQKEVELRRICFSLNGNEIRNNENTKKKGIQVNTDRKVLKVLPKVP